MTNNADAVCEACARKPLPTGWCLTGDSLTVRDPYDCGMCGHVAEEGDTFYVIKENQA